MSINDKIKQILIDKNLSPSYFADEIGVQRSSISHILSGRNRPSFDIIQKIIRRFPDLGYEWIMEEEAPTSNAALGYGNRTRLQSDRYGPESVSTSYGASNAPNALPLNRGIQQNELPGATMAGPQPVSMNEGNPAPASIASAIDKQIERILIFFTDGSFKEYSSTRS